MVADADERLQQFLSENPIAAYEWAENRKLMNDPRATDSVTCYGGRVLMNCPSSSNVIIGDMSCVGPRPVVAAEIPRYGTYAREYFTSRPGLTGLWQVSGRSSTSYARRIALDRYYARRWSMHLDLAILVRTIPACIEGELKAPERVATLHPFVEVSFFELACASWPNSDEAISSRRRGDVN